MTENGVTESISEGQLSRIFHFVSNDSFPMKAAKIKRIILRELIEQTLP